MSYSGKYLRKIFHSGFTLLELMVVVVVAAILLTIGIPSFQTYMVNQRLKTASFDWFSGLSFARSEAIKRRISISMLWCKNFDGSKCNNDADTTWNDGWVIFTDSDNDGTLDSGDNIIKIHPSFDSNIIIDGPIAAVIYRSDGRLNTAINSIKIHASNINVTKKARCVRIDLSGLPASSELVDSSGTCP